MPQTTPERAARWPGLDSQAMEFLKRKEFKLTNAWSWDKPTPDHILTDREEDAILYLMQEWDFGGIEQAP